jgi:hypothetical protein
MPTAVGWSVRSARPPYRITVADKGEISMIPENRLKRRRSLKLGESLGRIGGYALAFFMAKGIAWLILPLVFWLAK